jgi:cobalt-zinc-cadmium efflux system outer membrane protein
MKGLALVALLLFVPSALASAKPDDDLPAQVTWPALVELIRKRSPRLRAVTTRAHAAQTEVAVALRIPNPIVSYLGYGRVSGTSQAINGSQHQIEVEQEIPVWGQRRARREAARAGVALAEQNAAKLQNDLFVQARLAFVSLLTGQAQHAHLRAARQRMSELRLLVEGRVKTGLLGAFDLQRILLEEKRFQNSEARARVRVERLAGELALIVDAPSWLPEALGDLSVSEPSKQSEQTLDAPEVRVAQAEDHASRLNVELIGRERLPALTLTAGAYVTTVGDSTSLLGGVAMPIPSFDTGKAVEERARRESAAASAMRASVEAESNALRHVAERERASLAAAYSSFAQGTPEQLQALRTMAEQSYRAGTMTINVLLETLRAEIEVQLETLDALQELLIADVRERALSGRVTEP